MVIANILLRWLICAHVAAAGIMLAWCGRAVAQDARTADAHIAPRQDPSISSLTLALSAASLEQESERCDVIMAKIAEKGTGAIPGLLYVIANAPDRAERMLATMPLARLEASARGATRPLMLAFATEKEAFTRGAILKTVVRINENDFSWAESYLDGIVSALHDSERILCVEAAFVLGHLGPRAKNTVPHLLEVLGNEEADKNCRLMAVWAIAAIEPASKVAEQLMHVFSTARDSSVRAKILRELTKLYKDNPCWAEPYFQEIVDALREFDLVVSVEAALILHRLGPRAKDAVPQLMTVLDNDSADVNHWALVAWALVAIAPDSQTPREALRLALKAPELHSSVETVVREGRGGLGLEIE